MFYRNLCKTVLAGLVVCPLIVSGYAQSTTNPAGKDRDPQTKSGSQPSTTPATPGSQSTTGSSRGMSGSHPTGDMMQLVEMNVAEIEAGRMASGKATNPQVKEFADRMVRDHTEALNKLGAMHGTSGASGTSGAPGTGATPGTSGTSAAGRASAGSATSAQSNPFPDVKPNAKHQQTADRLSKLSGAEFDREYMKAMVADHQEAVRFLEQHGNNKSAASDAKKGGTSGADRNTKGGTADTMSAGDNDLSGVAQEMLPTVRQHLQMAQDIEKELQGGSGKKPRK